jgi:hypothetical protein
MSDLPSKILDPSHVRSNVAAVIKTLEEHSVRGVPLDPKLVEALPIVCAQLLQSKTDRVKAAGVKLILAAMKHNLELVGLADKMNRLDSGTPTESVAVHDAATLRADPEIRAKALDVARAMNNGTDLQR